MSKRAERRHHRERLWEKRKRSYWGAAYRLSEISKSVVDTPHPCSLMCCGNRRRYEGATMQERRAFVCD